MRLNLQSKLSAPLPAVVPGTDAAIILLTTIGTTLAYIAAMTVLIQQVANEFVTLVTRVPRFDFSLVDGVEHGNSSFLMFSLFRDASVFFFVIVFILFGILLALKQANLVTSDVLKNMFKSAIFGIIIVMIFPYIWDPISNMAENSGVWVLNPLYSFDEENPCIQTDDKRSLALANEHSRMLRSMQVIKSDIPDDPFTNKDICEPRLRADYLFNKAIFGATTEVVKDKKDKPQWWDVFSLIEAQIAGVSEAMFSVMFVGLTKMVMLFFLVTMAATLSSMRQLLTDVIMISLPLLLVLRSLPVFGIDRLANTLLTVFVPLLFVPFFTALIITAGSTSLLGLETDLSVINGDDANSVATDRYLFWIYSIATLSLAIMTPVMFVPMLGSVSSMVGKMAMTGSIASVMGAMTAAKGAGKGAAAGAKGFTDAAAGSASLFSVGGMKSMIGGAVSGVKSDMGSMFNHDASSAGRVMPGSGQLFPTIDTSGDNTIMDNAERRGAINAFQQLGVDKTDVQKITYDNNLSKTPPSSTVSVPPSTGNTKSNTGTSTGSTSGKHNLSSVGNLNSFHKDQLTGSNKYLQ